jgi:hypothetical protein
LFFETIISEETSVRLEMQQRLIGKMKAVDKAARESSVYVGEKILEFNEQLEKAEITLNQCLDGIAALIGIKYERFKTKKRNENGTDDEDD